MTINVAKVYFLICMAHAAGFMIMTKLFIGGWLNNRASASLSIMTFQSSKHKFYYPICWISMNIWRWT